jgi:hypothetical protein
VISRKDILLNPGQVTYLTYMLGEQGKLDIRTSIETKIEVPEDVKFSVNGRFPENPTLSDFVETIRNIDAKEEIPVFQALTDQQFRNGLRNHIEYLKETSAAPYHLKHVVPALQEMIDGKSWPRGGAFMLVPVRSNEPGIRTLHFTFPTPNAEETSYKCVLQITTEDHSLKISARK